MSSVLFTGSAEYPEHCKIFKQINDLANDIKRVEAGVKVPVGIG